MSAELITCPRCKEEKELRYAGDEVVSETRCKCSTVPRFNSENWVEIVQGLAEELTRKAICRKSQNGSTF